jgi:photosystem II stability/assembly factor-like uncharacterized protein
MPSGNIIALTSHQSGAIIAFTETFEHNPIHPYLPYNHIYAWRSTDGGTTWSLSDVKGAYDISQLDYRNRLTSIATDSSHNLLAGFSDENGYVIRSTDAGMTWVLVPPFLTTGNISGLAVRFNGDIFAASTTEGIFRSTDNGVTWDQLNKGITNQNLFSVAVHQNGDIYAGGHNLIFRSNDDGLSWQTLTTNFPVNSGNVTAMVVSTQGNIIAGVENGGVYWSTDNGTTWSERASGMTAKKVFSLLSTPIGKVFAGTDQGVFYLDTTAGISWVQYSGGITANNVQALCRDANGRLYAGTDASGVFSSVQTFNIITPAEVKLTGNNAATTALRTNYPNPFSSSTTIPFSLTERSFITIEVLDALGRSVAQVASGVYEAGKYETKFDAGNVAAGTYFVRLRTERNSYVLPVSLTR